MRTIVPTVPFLFCSLLAAQQIDPGEVVRGAFGVALHEGEVHGLGPDYSARFASDGVTFRPLVTATPTVRPDVHWRTDRVQRGGRTIWKRTADTAPTVAEDTVRYRLADGLDEVYEVRRDGIEQSFVFASKPAGRGDLVVSCSIATGLPTTAEPAGGLLCAAPGADGVRFGAVTGVDANGARIGGSVRIVGTTLELSLPDGFVESASYPLVLDPLIGSAFTLATSTNASVSNPSVAFDDSTNRYLVVWIVSETETELRGQLVDANGGAVGSAILIDVSSDSFPFSSHSISLGPNSVANINSVNRFLVAWRSTDTLGASTTYRLRMAAVNASNGAVSNAVSAYASSTFPLYYVGSYAVGGNRLATGTNSDVAWVVYDANGIDAAQVQVPATGQPVKLSNTPLGYGDSIAITNDGGTMPRWLVCWTESLLPSTQQTIVRAQPLSGSGPCGTPLTLFTAAAGDTVRDCACATQNGAHHLVAWANTAGGGSDLQVTSLDHAGLCGSLTTTQGAVLTLPAAVGIQDHPALAFVAGKCVAVWRHRANLLSPARVHAMCLHPVTGAPAGADLQVDGNTVLSQEVPDIATRWSAGDTASDEALIVWTTGSLRARRFEAFGGGSVTILGGGCGISGLNDFATYTGLPTLGTSFSIELAAPTAPVLGLIVGFAQNPVACGPCTIVPTADVILGGGGPVNVNVPLDANLIGVSLYTQWVQWRQAGCQLLPSFGFSNALRFTIAE